MNKKISLVKTAVSLLALCLLLFGCANKTTPTPNAAADATSTPIAATATPDATATPETTPTPTATPAPVTTGTPATPPSTYPNVTIVRADYDNNSFLTYPQINGGDPAINDMIREDILTIYESFLPTEDDGDWTITIQLNGDVKFLSDGWISVAYEGWFHGQGAAYSPSIFYSLNINPTTRQRMCLTDYVTVDQAFVDSVWEAVEQQHGSALQQYLTYDLAPAAALHRFQQCDRGGSELCSYRTADGVTIALSVPHVYGDYLLVTLPN